MARVKRSGAIALLLVVVSVAAVGGLLAVVRISRSHQHLHFARAVPVSEPPTTAEAAGQPADAEPIAPPPVHPDREAVPAGPTAPIISHIATSQPVVFVTIDDGWVRDPGLLALEQSEHLPLTLFLIQRAVQADPAYFRALHAAGAAIEDHTVDHPRLTHLSYNGQRREICGDRTYLTATFGAPVALFRPPYGEMNRATQRSARACGLEAVVRWDGVMNNGQLRLVGPRLRAGDIILLHFRPYIRSDVETLLADIRAAGLTPALLESYIGPPPSPGK